MSFYRGQKVVCVDDEFAPGIEQLYVALPKQDKVYVIREVVDGVDLNGHKGEVCVYLIGLHNPRSSSPPNPERGFSSARFEPLVEETDSETKHEDKEIYA